MNNWMNNVLRVIAVLVVCAIKKLSADNGHIPSEINDDVENSIKATNLMNINHFSQKKLLSYKHFQTVFQCSKDQTMIKRWRKRLQMYQIRPEAYQSAACHIAEYDNMNEILYRWAETLSLGLNWYTYAK